jgi:voltage-gated potassium channel
MLFHLLRQRLRSRFQQRMTLVTVWTIWLGLLVTCIIAAIALARAESIAFGDALWQVWQTITTVGYGDGPAKTVIGRLFTVGYSVVGIALFSKLITAIADHREDVREKRRYGFMKSPQTNGYVILQYPGATRLLTLIEEIRFLEPQVPICVVDSSLEELPAAVRVFGNIHFVRGKLIDRSTYEQARLAEAKTIIVFPNLALGDDADGSTRTIVELVEQEIPETIRVTYMLADAANEWMFKTIRGTPIHADVEILALVQEVQDPHTAAAIQHLLSNRSGANPNTVPVKRTAGLTWGDFVLKLASVSVRDNIPLIPFALVQDGTPAHCPAYASRLAVGDHIILISQEDLDWDGLERKIMA